ncbi:WSSV028 [White spot syndrome virus]|uniref:WSSV028 n=1 Tax=White spot syndrome virus TaxID=342409 RepID=A0A2I6SBF9_9VIRU|nr:WSSV028 [White spot syndrome virus]
MIQKRKRGGEIEDEGVECEIERNDGKNDENGVRIKDPINISFFARKAHWWNCSSGVVSTTFKEKNIVYNMLHRGAMPFSIKDCTDSPWLNETDAVYRHCKKPIEYEGKFSKSEVKLP